MTPRAAALLLLVARATALAAEQGPDARWRTVETDHFLVHYPEPFEGFARHAAARLEPIHERVTSMVGYTPAGRTDVVIVDPVAEANGMALPFLDRPSVVLYTHAPGAESGIGHFRDWSELLVTHEVAHVVHLARPRNRSRRILERLSPLPLGPLALRTPRFATEGYATLVEGRLTGSGRPHGSFRAMVLRRFAVDGKLPPYGRLDATGGWLGGSMAYLVGSSFLEWLEAREGEGALPRLWRRMASVRRASFAEAFRAVFGEHPRDLYDRFAAETTAAALDEERRLQAAGLVEGELWQRLDGGTSAPVVSRDGRYLLARRDDPEGGARLAVWEIEETEAERRHEQERQEREARRLQDPEEVADRPVTPRPRRPAFVLPALHGRAPGHARFLPDGRRVLFSLPVPDVEGVLHADLHVWRLGEGVSRLTRGADLSMADPSPDGTWAIAVQSRHGGSRLARVALPSGVASILDAADAGPRDVWNHPRISPDGSRIAALRHREGRWRLAVLAADGSGAAEPALEGNPAGPPAWSPDGKVIYVATDRHGLWGIERLDPDGSAPPVTLTLVTGGALAPAPDPDGRWLYFLEVTSRGVSLRRLPLGGALPSPPPPRAVAPVMPPGPVEVPALEPRAIPDPHAYRPGESLVVRPSFGYALGPSGSSLQAGLAGGDAIGRLGFTIHGSGGDAATPRGAGAALAWRGLPVSLELRSFWWSERPGEQRLARRPDMDQDRAGIVLEARRSLRLPSGRVLLHGGAAWSRVRLLHGDPESVPRTLALAGAEIDVARRRGKTALGAALAFQAASGRTDGAAHTLGRCELRLRGATSWGRAGIDAGAMAVSGDPSPIDLPSLGGAPSVASPVLDANRALVPALPSHLQIGERLETLRFEVGPPSLPVRAFATWGRVRDGGASGADPVRVLGVDVRATEEVLPLAVAGAVTAYAGVAHVRSEDPAISSIAAYAGISYRP